MSIDASSSIGKVRLRVGDWQDLVILPDSVYQVTIDENNGNLPAASVTIAQYLLAIFSQKSHKKLAQMEIWNDTVYKNYKDYLISVISNPSLMSYTALPYLITDDCVGDSPLKDFVNDWNNCWQGDTVSERIHDLASTKGLQPNWWDV